MSSYTPTLPLYPDPPQTGQIPQVFGSFPVPTVTIPSLIKSFHCCQVMPLLTSSSLRAFLSNSLKVSKAFKYFGSVPTLIFVEQCEQTFLQSLCAITRLKVPATIKGFAPRLKALVKVSTAEFVWIVENTRCPVMADSMAISSVSLSRISPTMITSGSCLRADLRPERKVYQISDLT